MDANNHSEGPDLHVDYVLNGKRYSERVNPGGRLLDHLRERHGLRSVKEGCGTGECGACTVLLDGKPVCSCLVVMGQVTGREVTTIEGIMANGRLHPVQQAFIDAGAVQCGFCTPGMVLAVTALLDENPGPTEEDVKKALEGNLCRCTGYNKIIEAVHATTERSGQEGTEEP